MHSPRLQLRHYHFNQLSLTACADFDPERLQQSDRLYPSLQDDALVADIRSAMLDGGDEVLIVVTLRLAYEAPDDRSFPYALAVEAEGFFAIDTTQNERLEACERPAAMEAAGSLYAAIREQILTVSSRHKFGPMLLPDRTFRDPPSTVR